MSEKIVRAKRSDQLLFRKANDRGWNTVSVVAWSILDSGPATPITAFGRFDTTKPYVVGTSSGYIAFPHGHLFGDEPALYHYLKTGEAEGVW